MAELLSKYENEIETITLAPSDAGRFEVSVNGKTIYSKLKTHRHAEKAKLPGWSKNS